MKCSVCFRRCDLMEGQTGFCRARKQVNGDSRSVNYGLLTALALDPIEKKPLAMFHPGSRILSVGSFGCNLRCPFCQNFEISQADEHTVSARYMAPSELCALAESLKNRGNIGVAFTYNEPLVSWEYVRDTARLVHEAGLLNVIVTNGTANLNVMDSMWDYIDAMNIDLKSWKYEVYRDVLGGDLSMVMDMIKEAVRRCHVELTTLIVPGMNDSRTEMEEEAAWIASIDPDIPLHVTRFFPRWKAAGYHPTEVKTVYALADTAGKFLRNVYVGNC